MTRYNSVTTFGPVATVGPLTNSDCCRRPGRSREASGIPVIPVLAARLATRSCENQDHGAGINNKFSGCSSLAVGETFVYQISIAAKGQYSPSTGSRHASLATIYAERTLTAFAGAADIKPSEYYCGRA